MNFDPLSFAIGKHGDSGPVRDVVSYLIGRVAGTAGEIWQTLTNVAIASFTAVSDTLRALVFDVTPIQSGSGDPSPTNVCPISGWSAVNVTRTGKNLVGGITFANYVKASMPGATINTDAKTVSFLSAQSVSRPILCEPYFKFKPNTQYTFIYSIMKSSDDQASNLRIYYSDGTHENMKSNSAGGTKGVRIVVSAEGKTVESIRKYQGSGTTTLWYDEFCLLEGVWTIDDFVLYNGTTYVIDWQSEAGTVYGGTLTDNSDGTWTLTKTHEIVALDSLTWNLGASGVFYTASLANLIQRPGAADRLSDSLCSIFHQVTAASRPAYANYTDGDYVVTTNGNVYAKIDDTVLTVPDFLSAISDSQFVYRLATPAAPITLTADSVQALIGQNNIFADTGNINTITFRTH